MNMEFRKLEYNDYYKGYIDLLNRLSVCTQISEPQFLKFINLLNENHIVLVLEHNNKIIATGTLFIENKLIRNCGKVGHIEDIVVDPDYRNKHIGKHIMEELIKYAEEKNCYKVSLYCSKENMKFYEKCGLTKKEEQMTKYFHSKL
jgi:glucosamine-phosphate N-acetyltransferase